MHNELVTGLRGGFKKIFEDWKQPLMNSYQDPERYGIPKGEEIGFSKKKYEAALSHILFKRPYNVNELAAYLEISGNQLRVWRNQDKFKSAIEKAINNFVAS